MIEIPPRFLINNRPLDENFEEDESLYIRFSASEYNVTGTNRLPVGAIKFPDCSVNRGKYSQPSDVLIPNWIFHGIAEIKVKDIPKTLKSEDKNARQFEFKVEHDPIDINHKYYSKQLFENYAHSEIRVYENGIHQKKDESKLPKTINKRYRTLISERAIIEILPPAPIEEDYNQPFF